MNRILVNLKWQILDRGCRLRIPMAYFIVLDLILLALPVSVCQYLDRNLNFLVHIVNLTYAFSLVFLFFYGLSYVNQEGNDVAGREFVRLAQPNPWIRLLIRLLTNTVFSFLCFANILLGSRLMGKFADENHSYLKLTMNGNIPKGFLMFAIVLPLLYHFILLLAHDRNIRYPSIPAMILLLFLIYAPYNSLSHRLPSGVMLVLTIVIMLLVFWKAGDLDQ